MLDRKSEFDLVHKSLDGWGFSFRRSQLFRFNKYKNILNPIKINGKILEIGCSTGFFSNKYLSPIFSKCLIACDISSVAIEKAKSRYPYINFKVASLPELDIEAQQFGLITAIELLYYLDVSEQRKSIEKIHKLLEPKGYLLVSVNIGDKSYFSVDEIEELIKHRFEIVQTDSLYIKTYYKVVETRIWGLLTLVSDTTQFVIKQTDSKVRKMGKTIINKVFRHKLAYYTYGKIIAWMCKGLLYIMPIALINAVSKWINQEKERSVYIILAQKK
jgi:SAM-dependent methyltransferase